MAVGSIQPLTEMSTRSIYWSKGGRCVTTYHYEHVMGPVEDTTRSGICSEPRISIRVGLSDSHTTHGTMGEWRSKRFHRDLKSTHKHRRE